MPDQSYQECQADDTPANGSHQGDIVHTGEGYDLCEEHYLRFNEHGIYIGGVWRKAEPAD